MKVISLHRYEIMIDEFKHKQNIDLKPDSSHYINNLVVDGI